jgi:hypothetical protein
MERRNQETQPKERKDSTQERNPTGLIIYLPYLASGRRNHLKPI